MSDECGIMNQGSSDVNVVKIYREVPAAPLNRPEAIYSDSVAEANAIRLWSRRPTSLSICIKRRRRFYPRLQ